MRYFWLIGFATLLGLFTPLTIDGPAPEAPSGLESVDGDFSARDVMTIPQGNS